MTRVEAGKRFTVEGVGLIGLRVEALGCTDGGLGLT